MKDQADPQPHTSHSPLPPKLPQILRPPLRTPPRKSLNLLQQLQNSLLLTLMAHPLPRDPQRLNRIRPRSMIIIANRDPTDLPRVPEDGVGFRCNGGVERFVT